MKIIIPFKTPTCNHLYGRHSKGFMFIKAEARELQKEIKEIVLKDISFVIPNLNSGLRVIVEIHENWFCKNGDVKRKDIANREKFLIDSVFNAIGIDDKFIFEHRLIKVQDTEEFAIVEIEEFK